MKTYPIVEVDISGITERDELHERLSAAFGFPSYYGKNWDAFWDCVATLASTPDKIEIRGMKALTKTLPREAALLKKRLVDFQSTLEGSGIKLVFE